MKGFDASKFQGTNIDFRKAKSAGYEFVILNAGGGDSVSQKDPTFDRNVAAALVAGIHVGAYWVGYATSIADAQTESKCFQQVLKSYTGKLDFPVAYDYEYAGIEYFKRMKGTYPSREFLTSMMKAFMSDMRQHNWFPANYTNCDFLRTKIYGSELTDFPTWLADYSGGPDFACTIQQTSESGTIPGIDGHLVDLDTCFVDYPTIIRAARLNGFSKGSAALKCDTTCDVDIKAGNSYTALISAPSKPVMTVGSSGVVSTVLTPCGNNWLFKMTAVGKPGSGAGVFANGKKLFAVNIK